MSHETMIWIGVLVILAGYATWALVDRARKRRAEEEEEYEED